MHSPTRKHSVNRFTVYLTPEGEHGNTGSIKDQGSDNNSAARKQSAPPLKNWDTAIPQNNNRIPFQRLHVSEINPAFSSSDSFQDISSLSNNPNNNETPICTGILNNLPVTGAPPNSQFNAGQVAHGSESPTPKRHPFLRLVSVFGNAPIFSRQFNVSNAAASAGGCGGESAGARDSTDSAGFSPSIAGARARGLFSRSFRHVKTMERIPCIDNYRIDLTGVPDRLKRPSMQELLGEGPCSEIVSMADLTQIGGGQPPIDQVNVFDADKNLSTDDKKVDKKPAEVKKYEPNKFGWVKGVLIRCFLNILGVMLFMRLSWITGQAGIGLATLIILLSTTVSVLTALSMCAICTNGEVRGGGVYFMISRSLGPPFGGAIGIIFSFANALAVAMHVVGFAETVRDLIKEHGAAIVDNGTNDIRIIGIATVCLLLIICLVGLEFEAIMQVGLMFILTAALVNYVVGTIIPPTLEDKARGILGYQGSLLVENFVPQYRDDYNFIKLFAIFFPSVTGIAAGANISGDLKDPQMSIPKGTLWAIVLTDLIYIGTVWLTGSTCVRDASGSVYDYLLGNFTNCARDGSCKYGLMNYYQVMEMDSAFGPLITAGIFAATLSSALACLVSAPKIFQAVCNDNIFPFIHVFAVGYGKSQEPKRSYVLTFAIAVCIILIGDLNIIAPIISNFYLAAYSLINYACFDATISKSPGFRPSFKYFNKFLALLGAALCIAVMFIMNWYYALITYAIVAVLYIYILQKKPDINWGSSTDANLYKNALRLIYRLQGTTEHVKTFRPQILILAGNPSHRPSMVDLCSSITKDNCLMMCGHVIVKNDLEDKRQQMACIQRYRDALRIWFKSRRVKSFYYALAAKSYPDGVQGLIQTAGISKLRPNIIMLGFKSNWKEAKWSETMDYFRVLVDAFEENFGVMILHLNHGQDYSDLMQTYRLADELKFPVNLESAVLCLASVSATASLALLALKKSRTESMTSILSTDDETDRQLSKPPEPEVEQKTVTSVSKFSQHFHRARKLIQRKDKDDVPILNIDLEQLRAIKSADVLDEFELVHAQKEILAAVNQFQKRAKKPSVDVWWLYDDGGLTMLIAHLLVMEKSHFANARLRVFTLAASRTTLKEEKKEMALLLQKFRIQASEVIVIPDIAKRPRTESLVEFDKIISKYVVQSSSESGPEANAGLVSEEELKALKEKTYRVLRTRELLVENSMDAGLIVLTFPVPRKNTSAALYMAWLDFLTKSLPPVLMIRGNQQSVLTFYS